MPWGKVKEAESEAKNANAKAEKDKMRQATQKKVIESIKGKTDPKFVDTWNSNIEQARKDIKAGL